MSLSDNHLQTGIHILVSDIGLNRTDGLTCWRNIRIISGFFGWHYKFKQSETRIQKNGNYKGWYSEDWFKNAIPHVTLTRRRDRFANEGILTCKDSLDSSTATVNVHYPSKCSHLCVFCSYRNNYCI